MAVHGAFRGLLLLGKRWGLLLLVPVVVAGAVIHADSLRTRAEREQLEQTLFVKLKGTLALDHTLESLLVSTPGLIGSVTRTLEADDREVAATISQLKRAATGQGVNDHLQSVELPRAYAADEVSIGGVLALAAAGHTARARTVYAHLRERLVRLDAVVRRASAQQDVAASSTRAAAFRGDLLGYGGAGLIIMLIFVLLMRARRASERKVVAVAMTGERRRYREIGETANEGVWTIDENYETTLVNQKMAEMLGYEPEQMLGRPVFDFMDSAVTQEAQRNLSRVMEGASLQLEFPLRGRDGREVWTLVCMGPLRDEQGRNSGALAMISDISERRDLESRLRELADHDPLTGIYNRRLLIGEVVRQLDYARRYRSAGAVLTLDLDNFKFANDTYGHATGDAMLKSVAEILTARTRDTDLVARLSGDEFAILLPKATQEGALQMASDIRSLLCERTIGPPIATSIGVATFAGDEEITADEILVCADIALYEAKEQGGDRAKLYTGQASGALTWVKRIRTALTEGRFVLYGQPIVDLRTGLVDRHELLVRMLSEDGDIILPGAFIPTAERFGLIGELDRWVVSEGLRLALAGERVSINLSGPSIGEQPIIAAVHQAVAAGLSPGDVIFEVTETVAMTDMTNARLFADTLRSMGCQLAIDDFGTGFGSFFSLKYLPARYLKIDIEFVRNIATDHTNQQMVRSMIDIAHSLDKLTIAEGVEDAKTLTILRDLGADYAQGFHLGRPQRLPPTTAFKRALTASRDTEIHHADDPRKAALQSYDPSPA